MLFVESGTTALAPVIEQVGSGFTVTVALPKAMPEQFASEIVATV